MKKNKDLINREKAQAQSGPPDPDGFGD